MSSITEVLRGDDSPEQKLSSIVNIVKNVRESYGNSESDIPVPSFTTADGELPLSAMSTESKLALAEMQVKNILVEVLETEEYVKGLNTEKFVESKIATNDVLANLGVKVSFGSL